MSFTCASTSLNLIEDLSILNLIIVPKKSCLTNARHSDHSHDSIHYLRLGLVAMTTIIVVVLVAMGLRRVKYGQVLPC